MNRLNKSHLTDSTHEHLYGSSNVTDDNTNSYNSIEMSQKGPANNYCKQNFTDEVNSAINKQINTELYASYYYQNAARYFERYDVALYNVAKFFQDNSNEEREHAEMFQKYIINRGGTLELDTIEKPPTDYQNTLDAMTQALQLEKKVNLSLLKIHQLASTHNDSHLADYLEEHFLDEQVRAIKQLSDYVSNLQKVGTGLGEYMFDKHLSIE